MNYFQLMQQSSDGPLGVSSNLNAMQPCHHPYTNVNRIRLTTIHSGRQTRVKIPPCSRNSPIRNDSSSSRLAAPTSASSASSPSPSPLPYPRPPAGRGQPFPAHVQPSPWQHLWRQKQLAQLWSGQAKRSEERSVVLCLWEQQVPSSPLERLE